MAHIFRKGGIPALASRLFDDLSPCLCSLIVKVDDAHAQATIILEFKLSSKDPGNDQVVSLVYDADNLVYGTTTLRTASPFPPRWGEITRNGGSDLKTLSFVLRDPCPILCPVAFERDDADPRFQQLEDLAKATRISVVFDYAWLHPNKSAQFSSLVGRSRLAGIPRKNTSTLIREADWTALAPQFKNPTEVEAPEAPPPYADVSRKRSRRCKCFCLANVFVQLTSLSGRIARVSRCETFFHRRCDSRAFVADRKGNHCNSNPKPAAHSRVTLTYLWYHDYTRRGGECCGEATPWNTGSHVTRHAYAYARSTNVLAFAWCVAISTEPYVSATQTHPQPHNRLH